MRKIKALEKFRNKALEIKCYGCIGNKYNGVFTIPAYDGNIYRVIASKNMGWEHVSISHPDFTPSWDIMCFFKKLFFKDEETVVQFHPKSSEYVNMHPHCLHMWKKENQEFELPPTILVGIKDGNNGKG